MIINIISSHHAFETCIESLESDLENFYEVFNNNDSDKWLQAMKDEEE